MSIGFRMKRGEGDDRVGDVCKEMRMSWGVIHKGRPRGRKLANFADKQYRARLKGGC